MLSRPVGDGISDEGHDDNAGMDEVVNSLLLAATDAGVTQEVGKGASLELCLVHHKYDTAKPCTVSVTALGEQQSAMHALLAPAGWPMDTSISSHAQCQAPAHVPHVTDMVGMPGGVFRIGRVNTE